MGLGNCPLVVTDIVSIQQQSMKLHMMQSGVKTLAHLLSRAGMDNLLGVYEGASSSSADRDEAKKLDVVAVSILIHLEGYK